MNSADNIRSFVEITRVDLYIKVIPYYVGKPLPIHRTVRDHGADMERRFWMRQQVQRPVVRRVKREFKEEVAGLKRIA